MYLSKVINHEGREKRSLSKALLKSFSLVTATAVGCISIATSATAASFYFAFGSQGNLDGQFNNPFGIAVGSGGNIYVADTANNRVQVFDSNGNVVSTFGSYGTVGGQFSWPSGIAVDGGGKIYVADTLNDRIQVFNSSGVFQSAFGNGALSMPQGIAVGSGGEIYVADTANNCVQVFDSSGNVLSTLSICSPIPGTGNGEFSSPGGVTVDGVGNIYVADTFNNRVQVFNLNGVFQYAFGSLGSGKGQFNSPSGIAVRGGGNIYVADTFNNRVQVFRTPEPSTIIGLGILGGGLVVRRLAKRG